jgi:hypothetical protein
MQVFPLCASACIFETAVFRLTASQDDVGNEVNVRVVHNDDDAIVHVVLVTVTVQRLVSSTPEKDLQ